MQPLLQIFLYCRCGQSAGFVGAACLPAASRAFNAAERTLAETSPARGCAASGWACGAAAGRTGPAVAAHIHLGAKGKNGIALVALCAPCKSPISGTANSVTDDVGALMLKAGAYVNVHTDKNAEGEIRGEITGH